MPKNINLNHFSMFHSPQKISCSRTHSIARRFKQFRSIHYQTKFTIQNCFSGTRAALTQFATSLPTLLYTKKALSIFNKEFCPEIVYLWIQRNKHLLFSEKTFVHKACLNGFPSAGLHNFVIMYFSLKKNYLHFSTDFISPAVTAVRNPSQFTSQQHSFAAPDRFT